MLQWYLHFTMKIFAGTQLWRQISVKITPTASIMRPTAFIMRSIEFVMTQTASLL